MATLMMIAGIALTALGIGLLSGALLWRKRADTQAPPPQPTFTPPGPLLWDIHSLLNSMSRFAVAVERGHAINPATVYNLSDYLLHSSLLQREGGWADAHTLENWLQAHLAILAELRSQGTAPRVKVKFPERIQRLDANAFIRQLHRLLQRASTVDSIEIHATANELNLAATLSVTFLGAVDQAGLKPTDDQTPTWQMEAGRCFLQLSVECVPKAATEARVE